MVAGAEDLEQWMLDAIRQGLAALDNDPSEWETIASRMVDAKSRGLAQQLKTIATYREEDWPEQMLETFGQLYLTTQGLQQINKLPASLKEQLLIEAGVTIKRKDLLAQGGLEDEWLVLSRWRGVNLDQAAIQKTWLLGLTNQRIALLIEYDYLGDGFETNFQIGQVKTAEVIYYPESYPLRAILKKWSASEKKESSLMAYPDLETVLQKYAAALVLNPWLSRFPCLLENIIPLYGGDHFLLVDLNKKVVVANVKEVAGWTMFSISSGKPITLFGEWDGKAFHPLSIFKGQRYVDLGHMVSDTSGAKRFRSF